MQKVLVVDDEEMYRYYLAQFLEREGYEVKSAASGLEGIQVGRDFKPDVLIADWKLQNQYNGFDVSEALAGDNPELRTIIITGFLSPELERRTRGRVAEVIQKPFEPSDLLKVVRSAM